MYIEALQVAEEQRENDILSQVRIWFLTLLIMEEVSCNIIT